ncbi:hypothetical protein EDD16DRAFT_1525630 [Pisolithus croceorrhizus]|nr:hypothetical protein EDD16DRAFT_1525630 [Pisolithus croceorrhizus]
MTTEHELPMPGTLADKLASPQTPMSSSRSAMDMECSMTSMTTPKRQRGDVQEDVQTVHEDKGLFGDDDYNNMSLDKYSDVPTSVPLSWSTSESELQASESDGNRGELLPAQSILQPVRRSSTGKRSYKETDYSLALRQALYEKDELVNKLKSRLRQLKLTHQQEQDKLQRQLSEIQRSAQLELEEHKSRVATLEKIMNERETMYQQECKRLHEEIRINRETAASLERTMNERETVEMNNWVEKLSASSHLNLTHLMEQRDRELDEKAAKESEMANLEQRYARREHQATTKCPIHPVSPSRPNNDFSELPARTTSQMQSKAAQRYAHYERQATTRSPTRLASLPRSTTDFDEPSMHTTPLRQSKAAPRHSTVTPNLDVIKRSHLVGIRVEEDEPEILRTSTTEWETPMSPSHDNDQYQASTMIDAVTKGVEAALRSILANGQALPKLKRTPRSRRTEDHEVRAQRDLEASWQRDFCLDEVRRLFKEKFNFVHDTEFIGYESADPRDVHAYEYEDGPSPDVDSPIFDLMRGPSSAWNGAIIDNLLRALQTRCKDENWPIHRSDAYLRSLIVDRYRRLRTVWRNAQPKLTGKGVLETPAETESRLVAAREALLKANRQTTRRRNSVENLAKLKAEENEDDADAWKWLKDLTTTLGEHGMSSEESGIENEVEVVLRVKTLPWRRSVERELDLIDLQRLLDDDIFAPQGARPLRRIRAPGNPVSTRPVVKGLPTALYDRAWIAELSQRQLEALHIANVSFPWMKVAVS